MGSAARWKGEFESVSWAVQGEPRIATTWPGSRRSLSARTANSIALAPSARGAMIPEAKSPMPIARRSLDPEESTRGKV